MKIAFDIGGVLSKYPDIFRSLVNVLLHHGGADVEVYIISDMKPHAKAVAFCHDNGFLVPPEYILCADYEQHGEECKAVLCAQHEIDMLIDDHVGYLAILGTPPVRLLVMPDPTRDYYSPTWVCAPEDAKFGRRNPPGSKRPPEDRLLPVGSSQVVATRYIPAGTLIYRYPGSNDLFMLDNNGQRVYVSQVEDGKHA